MTAISKTIAFRGAQACKIAKLTTDNTSALIYAALYDVPIRGLSFTPQIETYELKHNDTLQEVDQQIQSYDISGTIARVPMDVLAIFTGGSVAASGSSPAQKQTYTHQSTDNPKYFKLALQSTRVMETDVGDAHVVFPKCKIMSYDFSIADEFATINFTAKAIRTINNATIKTIVANETATAIS